MVGIFDAVGVAAMAYLEAYGDRAQFRVDDDISAAVGQHRWDAAHQLNRVKLRLLRLRLTGHAGSGTKALPN